MPRIPDTEIERLRNEVSVERLVEASGIELKRGGKDMLGCCPFHEDDTASLVVTPGKNLWHCFGCGVGGGPIDWVMKRRGVSFRHAVELLREGVIPLAADGPVLNNPRLRVLPPPVALDADDQALLNQTVGYYHERLLATTEAQAYLAGRGLAHPELVAHFKLGVADRTLGLRLPEKTRKAGADIRARLQKIGLYRDSGHEHFNGSLVIPVFDEVGNVVEVYGRKLLDNLRAGTPKHLYLPAREGRTRGVFNVAALAVSKEIILCEALLDALTFWCAGYRNVTAAYGIEGFTDEHAEAFKRHGTERVLIAYDRDDAGERGAAKVTEALMAEGIECFRVQFPKGMDANEYALKVQPAAKSLGLLIRKAVWLGKGEAPQAVRGEAPKLASESTATQPTAAKEETTAPAAIPLAADPSPAAPEIEALPASPMPAAAREPGLEVREREQGREVTLMLGEGKTERRYRVRGLAKNLAVDVLKVNLMVAAGDAFHVDTLDLYSAKARAHYVAQAAQETGIADAVLKADLGRVLLALEQLQDQTIADVLKPEPQPQMADADRDAALALLKAPNLIERVLADFAAVGLVGEETNKLVGYLAAVSRKLDKPLGVVIQSSSAAGKSTLMDAVLAFVPEEEKVKYSAMTGQSLFYMGETSLKHKILAIAEEEGASRASYALKLLQSEGELTIASTGKDATTGNLVTQQYRVEGPVMIFLTTTAIEIDEELLNRCMVLSVDEGREQTEAIHRLQRARRTLQGLKAKQGKAHLVKLHQNAQRLLRALAVVNPYADRLTFLSDKTRTRRDHEKYLTLIDTIALLHQHQRSVRTMLAAGQAVEYIEVTAEDIAQANAIAHEVLGRSLDELPPQTRRLLASVVEHVRGQAKAQAVPQAEVRFTRKDVRERTGWGDTQLRVHLTRLHELEYLLAHRGMRGQSFEYELAFDGETGADAPHLVGLIDADDLAEHRVATTATTKASSRGSAPQFAAPSRGQNAPNAATLRASQPADKQALARLPADEPDDERKTHVLRPNGKHPSYVPPSLAAEVRQ